MGREGNGWKVMLNGELWVFNLGGCLRLFIDSFIYFFKIILTQS